MTGCTDFMCLPVGADGSPPRKIASSILDVAELSADVWIGNAELKRLGAVSRHHWAAVRLMNRA